MEKKIRLETRLVELQTLEKEVSKLEREWNLSGKNILEINLVLDEICTNIIEHGIKNECHYIDITIELKKNILKILVKDDGPEFNPTLAPWPDTSQSLNERPVGGLGIHLTRNYTDELNYSREKNTNVLELLKTI